MTDAGSSWYAVRCILVSGCLPARCRRTRSASRCGERHRITRRSRWPRPRRGITQRPSWRHRTRISDSLSPTVSRRSPATALRCSHCVLTGAYERPAAGPVPRRLLRHREREAALRGHCAVRASGCPAGRSATGKTWGRGAPCLSGHVGSAAAGGRTSLNGRAYRPDFRRSRAHERRKRRADLGKRGRAVRESCYYSTAHHLAGLGLDGMSCA
jgi:hypothetical protein